MKQGRSHSGLAGRGLGTLSNSWVVFLFLVLAAVATPGVAGETFVGKVSAVSDGDTLVVKRNGRAVVVQLDGIDAPELSQSFGVEARDFVAERAKKQRVEIAVVEETEQGVVGRVSIDGQDLSELLVAAGLAWAADDADSASLRTAQARARNEGTGLWSGSDPTPPWDFRSKRSS